MRTLVFGGTGIVGRAMVAEARRRGWAALGLTIEAADIRDPGRVAAAIAAFAPRLVVNCAAFTQVDRCESEPELAHAVNGTAVGVVIDAARRAGARTIHLSTDYVFDGRSSAPYREDHPVAPQSVYGESKLAGERCAEAEPGALVVRTSWVFGEGGSNFVDTLLDRMDAGVDRLRVVADQRGGPTYAPFLARALADLGESGVTGRVHYQNRDAVSWYEFAREIVRRYRPRVAVEPISSDEMPRPARRPAYSVLAVDRFEELAGRPVELWQDGLAAHLARRQRRAG